MRLVVQGLGTFLFFVGVSGAIDHLWYQPLFGIFLNWFNRLVVPSLPVLQGHALLANLGLAVVGVVLVLWMESLRPRAEH